MCLMRPGAVRLVERVVADQPLVIDRILVDQDERDRDAARNGRLGDVEAGVMDGDRDRL